jgi:hypothetical protein
VYASLGVAAPAVTIATTAKACETTREIRRDRVEVVVIFGSGGKFTTVPTQLSTAGREDVNAG